MATGQLSLLEAAAAVAVAEPVPYDYRKQKARLTRAVRSSDGDAIRAAVRQAVCEWNDSRDPWPDDWHRWQVAYNDTLPWHAGVDITDPFFA